jgi:threonine/homoserine efflux transporter RhtA
MWRACTAVGAVICILAGPVVLIAGGKAGIAWSLFVTGLGFALMSAATPCGEEDAAC